VDGVVGCIEVCCHAQEEVFADEAFALLCLENYEVKWRHQHKNEMLEQQLRKSGGSPSSAPTKGTIPKPRYTLGRTGWNNEGLGRFRELNDLVAKGRAYANSSEWDRRYKNRREEEYKNAIRTTTSKKFGSDCQLSR
jgi:hypothetical protein